MDYIKQLDSIRALAVILVIVSHWLPKSHILNIVPIGVIGVDVFFVLSGFLITSILFQSRNIPEATTKQILKTFYARRALRIFPIYYITIILLFIFHEYTESNIRSDFISYASYTSNINFFIQNQWDGMLSHLWSLSVEEQFYLVWPWVIVLVPEKYLLHAISFSIVLGVSSRLFFIDHQMGRILTTSCFDSFGIGALLSWFVMYNKDSLHKFYLGVKAVSFFLFLLLTYGALFRSNPYWLNIPLGTMDSIFSILLITYIYIYRNSEKFIFRYLFNNAGLVFIGKISYGIYLFHNILPTFSIIFIRKSQGYHPFIKYFFSFPSVINLTNLILLILLSWLSFKFIESPFLRLKKNFRIKKEARSLSKNVPAQLRFAKGGIDQNHYLP